MLAGCRRGRSRPVRPRIQSYQGWIEANLIFVAPDEIGPREDPERYARATRSTAGAPLFTVDDDLQQADLNLNMARLTNARQTFDRASALAKTGSGTQKDFDAAQAELRVAEAQRQLLADAARAPHAW